MAGCFCGSGGARGTELAPAALSERGRQRMTTGSLPTLLDPAQSRRLSAGGDPHAAARQARDEGPIWSSQLPISAGWIDLIRTNIVLEDVARRERLYLSTVVRDPAALTTMGIKQRVHPGTYRLAVDTTGTAFALSDGAGAVLDRGAIGDSIGAPLGFAWVAPAGMLRPGDVVVVTVTTPAEAATRLR